MSKGNVREASACYVRVRRGTIFQSLMSCATLAPCSSVVPHPISSVTAPLESHDLSLAFQAIDR